MRTISSVFGTDNGLLSTLVMLCVGLLLIRYSSLFEQEYPRNLINLYVYPWWRIMVILLVVAAALWCPQIGLLIALVVFFYLSDMNSLITPFSNL